jgi:protein-S-isoprenylcysteine O-methyltransferase Ste14
VVVFVAAYLLYGEVLRENIWLSRTVEVQPGQQVVDGGLYGVVRHPMYTATVLLFGSMPLILGSVQAFCIFLLYLPLIVCRIREEERFLERELEGYAQYRRRVKYRLLPFVW